MDSDHTITDSSPRVSVLMPTFKQASFIRRAIESLLFQTFKDWELIIVNDGSPDDTHELIKPFLQDPRFHYYNFSQNQGLGWALNFATRQARGTYLAYLPSDDIYYPGHLQQLVDLLDQTPEIYLAYGGVRWSYQTYGPTLKGEEVPGNEAVGNEKELLFNSPPAPKGARLTNNNILALVQVMHRRQYEDQVSWTTREEFVSDTLEPDFWRALFSCGAKFGYAGEISCEWVDHPDERHKIIGPPAGGLARYRTHYNISPDTWLKWQPAFGWKVDERTRFGKFDARRVLPEPGGLKILLVGELGFNPERVLAFEEKGHKLYGLWIPDPQIWDTAGPVPFGNIETIPFEPGWKERIAQIKPDIIYALLNWQGVDFIHQVLEARLNIPFVFHFKEGPFICQELGQWPRLLQILRESDGQIFISDETLEWFQQATANLLNPEKIMILDGDLPKLDWFTDDWAPKLSDQDGEIHTVCSGRPLGVDPFDDIAKAKIHVHFYGDFFHIFFPNWTRKGLDSGYMHVHPTVEPANWVKELSQYDAAWFHVFDSYNRGDLHRAHWDDLNLPARMGTYACAGLPWILKDNRHSRVSIQSLALQYDVGVFFKDFEELGQNLSNRPRLREQAENMRRVRKIFAFDTHVDELLQFFHRVIKEKEKGYARS